MDAIAAAQALSEIGYLLRQQEKERFRAKAFSSAAWSLALERPDLEELVRADGLTSLAGVGEGIARVLKDLLEHGESRYLNRLREQMQQPPMPDETDLDYADYHGDVHSHTGWSDGRASMLEMAEVQKQVDGLTLLQGIEVDILEDGALDLPDAVLEILDVVIASPHVKLRQDPAAMTERMLRAASHPHVDVIGHPTGRRPGSREGATYDFEAVFKEAAKHRIAVEIDCDPARMDLSPEMARMARDLGCNFVVSSDAHAPAEFAYVPMALWMARRAGIPRERILNFRPEWIDSDVKMSSN